MGGGQAPPSAARPRVFLSYRRSDTQHAAGRAADKLADRYELFMDIDTIPPGVDFAEYLRRAVGGCDVLLAFVGDRWADARDENGRRRLDDPADWVSAEISTALNRGVPVIPVLVDAAVLPSPENLPESLRPMVGRQAAPLRFDTFTADLNHLVAAIDHAALPRPARDHTATGPDSQPAFAEHWVKEPTTRARTPVGLAVPPGRRRILPLVVGVVVVALVGLATWLWLGQGRPSAIPPAGPTGPVTSTAPLPTVPAASSVTALRERVPAAFRSTCRRLTPTDPQLTAGIVVAVQCAPNARGNAGAPRFAFYFQYADATAAEAAFRGYYAAGAPAGGDCSGEPGEVPDDRPAGGSGVLRCYRDTNGYLVFAWSSPEQAIVASAADADRSFGELFRWWEGAGPTTP